MKLSTGTMLVALSTITTHPEIAMAQNGEGFGYSNVYDGQERIAPFDDVRVDIYRGSEHFWSGHFQLDGNDRSGQVFQAEADNRWSTTYCGGGVIIVTGNTPLESSSAQTNFSPERERLRVSLYRNNLTGGLPHYAVQMDWRYEEPVGEFDRSKACEPTHWRSQNVSLGGRTTLDQDGTATIYVDADFSFRISKW